MHGLRTAPEVFLIYTIYTLLLQLICTIVKELTRREYCCTCILPVCRGRIQEFSKRGACYFTIFAGENFNLKIQNLPKIGGVRLVPPPPPPQLNPLLVWMLHAPHFRRVVNHPIGLKLSNRKSKHLFISLL